MIDLVRPSETHDQAIDRLAAYGTALTVLTSTDAMAQYEASFRTEPHTITEREFVDMLSILPPADWRDTGDEESFKFIECTAGRMTAIGVRIGDRYFHFIDAETLSHADIIARVKASAAFMQHDPETVAPA